MSEEIFWTIGFQKVRHKRSRPVRVFLDNYKNSKLLKILSEDDMNRLVKFQSIRDANQRISEIKKAIEDVRGVNPDIIVRACFSFTPLKITKKNVESNTKR